MRRFAPGACLVVFVGFAGAGCGGSHVAGAQCDCPLGQLCGFDEECHPLCNVSWDCQECSDCIDGLCYPLTAAECETRVCGTSTCSQGCCWGGECREASPTMCGTGGAPCVDCTAEPRADSCSADGSCVCAAVGVLCAAGQYCDSSGCSLDCTPRCDGRCGGPDTCGGTCSDTCVLPKTCGGGGTDNVCGCTPACAGVCGGPDGCGGTCPDVCVLPETCGGGGVSNVCGEPVSQSPCVLPWGGSISHGQSVLAYQLSAVACGGTCTAQTRTCNNGTLSGSYTNSACSVQPCTCTAPWGGVIDNGGSVTAYAASSVACGDSCVAQTRTCNDGVLSGTYVKQACAPSCAACPTQTVVWSRYQVAWRDNPRTAGTYQCQASAAAGVHGTARSLTATGSTRIGTAIATCDDGTWEVSAPSCNGTLVSAPAGLTCSSSDPQLAKWIGWYSADLKRCADTSGLAYWVSEDNDTATVCPAYPVVGSTDRNTCVRAIFRESADNSVPAGEYTYAQTYGHVSVVMEEILCGDTAAYGWVSWDTQCKALP